MLYRKVFIPVQNLDIEDMGAVVGQMRNLLQAFSSSELPDHNKFTKSDIPHYIKSLLTKQRSPEESFPGSWATTTLVDKLDQETLVDFDYFPTAIGLSSLCFFYNKFPELIENHEDVLLSIQRATDFLAKTGLDGWGFDPLYQFMEFVFIFNEGNVLNNFGKQDFFSKIEDILLKKKEIIQAKIDKKEYLNSFGIDMEAQYREVLEILKKL